MTPEQHLEQAYRELDEVVKVQAVPLETSDPKADLAVARLRLKLAKIQQDLLRIKKQLPKILKVDALL